MKLYLIRHALTAEADDTISDGRGNKFRQASAVRVSKTNHSLNDGIYTADFAGCPEKSPRPF